MSQTSLRRRVLPVSIVIPTRNRPELVRQAVTAVLEGSALPAEIVVIDQSDPDLAGTHLKALESGNGCLVRHLCVPGRGASRARNLGLTVARNERIALIDDDIIVSPGWLNHLDRTLVTAGRRVVVTGSVLAAASPHARGFAPSTTTLNQPTVYASFITHDVLNTGNMALYRSAAEEIGGFDPRLGPGARFPAAEDNDFGFRLLAAGYRLWYEPEALVWHTAWRTDYLALRWAYGRGQGAFYAKHLGAGERRMLLRLGTTVGGTLLRGATRIRRKPLHACGALIYTAGLLSGFVQWSCAPRILLKRAREIDAGPVRGGRRRW